VAGDVEAAFSQGHTAAWPVLLRGAWLFSLQIYCDFSGYSDIARGTARLFGFELMRNFQQPYLATNVSEFWHRWHVSLSTFLRDYLYIPLGGSRGSRLKTHRNLMVTMLLGGLWHGANWTFVVWGGLHGAYLSIHRLLLRGQKPCERIRASTPAAFARDLMRVAVTFHIVTFTWVFFRAPSLADAFSYLWGLFTLRGGWAGQTFEMLRMAGFFALALLLDAPQYAACDDTVALRWRWTVRGALIAGLLLCIFLLAPADETPFIYFQF
jgi:D-alanyl-lipoteichoic acid acyltransferase DltB (MBOAT superfamily)